MLALAAMKVVTPLIVAGAVGLLLAGCEGTGSEGIEPPRDDSGYGSRLEGQGAEGSLRRRYEEGGPLRRRYEESSDGGGRLDPTPEKLDGTESYEFEQDDIEQAEEAPPSVREYCSGAVSEAQEVGCLSHIEPSEVP